MASTDDFLELLIGRTNPAIDSLEAWWRGYAPLAEAHPDTIVRAIVAGAAADRIGYAFAAGYQAALASIFGATRASSMLVTEQGGGHPRAMTTTLTARADTLVLEGEKRFATLGSFADVLYVLAKGGERDGLPALRVVAVPRDAAGIEIAAMPTTPFCPEISHATVRFSQTVVPASALLPGDGYARYVRPFRTVEDLHVFGAVVGHAVGVASSLRMPAPYVERLLSLAVLFVSLHAHDRDAPTTALALEGALVTARTTLAEMPAFLRERDPEACDRWERDAGIFKVAASARAARAAKARAALGL